MIKLKRAYEPPEPSDGARILVERLWPRGVTKDRAQLAEWMKEIAPSAELRKWYNHDPEKWDEFKKRYKTELRRHEDLVSRLRTIARNQTVTLVFAARDEERSSARMLKDHLEQKSRSK